VLDVYSNAVKNIEPENAINGNFSEIWVGFAMFYGKLEDMHNANTVFY
jgi:hypothetical protein